MSIYTLDYLLIQLGIISRGASQAFVYPITAFGSVTIVILGTGGLNSPFTCYFVVFPVMAIILGKNSMPIVLVLTLSCIILLLVLDLMDHPISNVRMTYIPWWRAVSLIASTISATARTQAVTSVLSKSLEAEQQANSVKSIFVANMSHGKLQDFHY